MFYLTSESNKEILAFNPFTMKLGKAAYNPGVLPGQQAAKLFEQKNYIEAPKILKIMLGTECNFRCEYCRQFEHTQQDPNRVVTPLVENFLDDLVKYLDLSNLKKVEYWGGEPLLYWDTATHIAQTLEAYTQRDLKHHFTTNGSLLTEEKMNWLMAHDFEYKLSHDGPGQLLRTADPLKDGTECKSLHHALYNTCKNSDRDQNFYINAVLTAVEPSPRKIVEWFKEEFDSDVQIRKMEPVIPYNEHSLRYALDLSNLDLWEDLFYQDLCTGDIIKNVMEYQNLWKTFLYQVNVDDYRYDPQEAKCHAAQQITLCVDLRGNITPCQVYSIDTPENITGHISRLTECNTQYRNPPATKKQCLECPVISLCRGVCPYITPGEYSTINCKVRYHTYKAILRMFLSAIGLRDVKFTTKTRELHAETDVI